MKLTYFSFAQKRNEQKKSAVAAKSSGTLSFWLPSCELMRTNDETSKNCNIFFHKLASAHPLPFRIKFHLTIQCVD